MLELQKMNDSLEISHHAQARMNQRSFSESDIQAILNYGTWLDDCSVVLTRKDVHRATEELRIVVKHLERQQSKVSEMPIKQYQKTIQDVERLQNSKVVVNGNTLVTCYHCNKSHIKRALRRMH